MNLSAACRRSDLLLSLVSSYNFLMYMKGQVNFPFFIYKSTNICLILAGTCEELGGVGATLRHDVPPLKFKTSGFGAHNKLTARVGFNMDALTMHMLRKEGLGLCFRCACT